MQTFPATKLGKPSKNTRLVELGGFTPVFLCHSEGGEEVGER